MRGAGAGGWHVFPLSPSSRNSWHSFWPDHYPGEGYPSQGRLCDCICVCPHPCPSRRSQSPPWAGACRGRIATPSIGRRGRGRPPSQAQGLLAATHVPGPVLAKEGVAGGCGIRRGCPRRVSLPGGRAGPRPALGRRGGGWPTGGPGAGQRARPTARGPRSPCPGRLAGPGRRRCCPGASSGAPAGRAARRPGLRPCGRFRRI